jgi:hypothetical protein
MTLPLAAQSHSAVQLAPTTPARMLPADFSGWHAAAPQKFTPSPADSKILDEYGLQSAESSVYQRGDQKLRAKAYRFTDATGAYGSFTYWRTPSMAAEKFCDEGASDGNHVMFYCSNVLVDVALDKVTAMTPSELRDLAATIPRVTGNLAELPKLPLHLSLTAQKNAKYVAGPAALDALNETVKSSLVDFSLSPEVVVAKQATLDGLATITLVQYPTPKIAQAQVQKMNDWAKTQAPDWQKSQQASSSDAMPTRFATRRSGPIAAVVTGQITENDARKILSDINYDAEVTWSEPTPTQKDNIGNLVYNIMLLAFIISGFMLVLGIAFGGFRIFMKKFFPGRLVDRPEDVEFIKLNLRD